MKKIILLLLVISTMLACSDQKSVEKKVKTFLKENLDDPKSYEPVEFGKIDTVWILFDYHPKYEKLSKQLYDYKYKGEYWTDKISDSLTPYLYPNINVRDSADFYIKKYNELKPKYDKALQGYEKEIDYLFIYHKFRANNKLGALIINDANFILDLNLNIVDVKYTTE